MDSRVIGRVGRNQRLDAPEPSLGIFQILSVLVRNRSIAYVRVVGIGTNLGGLSNRLIFDSRIGTNLLEFARYLIMW